MPYRGDRGMVKRNGFTLIEIIVAISVFATILTIIYSVFYTTVRARQTSGEVAEIYSRGINFLRNFSREIECAYLSPVWQGGPRTTIFKSDRDSVNGREMDIITFTHLCHQYVENETMNQSDHEEVTYFWQRDPKTDVINLMKRVDSTMDNDPEKGGIVFVSLENVVEFRLTFFNGTDWVEGWQDNGTLPNAVHLYLVLKDKSGGEVPFETTVPIFRASRIPSGVQQ
jgi:general secretion pathway protein J